MNTPDDSNRSKDMVTKSLSPKRMAAIVGASESSLKRWIDSGRLTASKTSGGHRRIDLTDAVEFIRENRLTVVRPDLLGLSLEADVRGRVSEEAQRDLLEKYLLEGKQAEAESLIVAGYLEGASVAEICDRLIQPALAHIGAIWAHDSYGIVLEHRATEICIRAVNLLRSYLPPVSGSPQAVGCAPSGDMYVLPSLCAAAVLEAEGIPVANLGSNLPFGAFLQAIDRLAPRFVWLSISHLENADAFQAEFEVFCRTLTQRSIPLILGGSDSGRVLIPEGAQVLRGRAMVDIADILSKFPRSNPAPIV